MSSSSNCSASDEEDQEDKGPTGLETKLSDLGFGDKDQEAPVTPPPKTPKGKGRAPNANLLKTPEGTSSYKGSSPLPDRERGVKESGFVYAFQVPIVSSPQDIVLVDVGKSGETAKSRKEAFDYLRDRLKRTKFNALKIVFGKDVKIRLQKTEEECLESTPEDICFLVYKAASEGEKALSDAECFLRYIIGTPAPRIFLEDISRQHYATLGDNTPEGGIESTKDAQTPKTFQEWFNGFKKVSGKKIGGNSGKLSFSEYVFVHKPVYDQLFQLYRSSKKLQTTDVVEKMKELSSRLSLKTEKVCLAVPNGQAKELIIVDCEAAYWHLEGLGAASSSSSN